MRQLTYAARCLALLSALFSPSIAVADGMRCGSRIVSEGDTLYDVRSVCGDPVETSRRVEYRTIRQHIPGPCVPQYGQMRCGYVEERTIEVVIDEWTYDLGSNKFIRYLTFEQGRLRDVQTGRYGNK
jgi:hypothetical protein